ncbi:hypothetical protein BS78_10G222600 [Paspalum vaginatum]|nr:hypothetical protein BS78_10G222600 [Paspalum vaginatum]
METPTEVDHSSKQIKIQGFSLTSAMSDGEVLRSRRCNVGGYDWEVQVLPRKYSDMEYMALKLYLCSEVSMDNSTVDVKFSSQFVDRSGKLKPYQACSVSHKFKRSGDCCSALFMVGGDLQAPSYLELKDDAFTVECTLTVLKEPHNKQTAHHHRRPADNLVPSSSLPRNLGELLEKGTGADVTLVVAGESFAAHKAILASRSPVFMAEFFGHMKEKRSQRVEVKGVEAAVFGAMLHFIYTDSVPELDGSDEDVDDGVVAMAQHLLAAADRYGIDRLKLTSEDWLYGVITVDTAATTLAVAEQHGCSDLKAKCVEVIAENLEAVMATDPYKHLVASCPAVMNDLLLAVHGRKN